MCGLHFMVHFEDGFWSWPFFSNMAFRVYVCVFVGRFYGGVGW